MPSLPNPDFWRGKRVLLTGHTGFKGSWAALWLKRMGATVIGVGLAPEGRSLYELAAIDRLVDSHIADICDVDTMPRIVSVARPDVVIHMAAQALVRKSIQRPYETYLTNVIGTGVLLDSVLKHAPDASTLVVTSDKVYKNDSSGRAFVEDDTLGGKDPYSASKAACEILVASHRETYFSPSKQPIATVRGGNVIGGGDFSQDRLIPDIIRAVEVDEQVVLRHPEATRPWQHVLDCLCGYFVFAEALAVREVPLAMNIGPDPSAGEFSVGEAASVMMDRLEGKGWRHEPVPGSIEAVALGINPELAAKTLEWRPRLQGRSALEKTADWYAAWRRGANAKVLTETQIAQFEAASL